MIAAFLGAVIQDGDKVIPIALERGACEEWFPDQKDQTLWSACVSLWREGNPLDLMTVNRELDRRGLLERVGLDTAEIYFEACPAVAHAEHYISQIENDYLNRSITACLENLVKESTGIKTAREFLAKCQNDICNIEARNIDHRTLYEVGVEEIESWSEADYGLNWPVELIGWQNYIGQLTDEVVWIVARPSVGKTALLLNMLMGMAWPIHDGGHVSLASLESKRNKLAQRMTAIMGKVNVLELMRGKAKHNAKEYAKAKEAWKKVKGLPMKVVDNSMTLDMLYAWAKNEVKNGSKLIAVDNSRHLRMTSKYKGDRSAFYGDISLTAKQIRDDFGVPVIMLHHAGREGQVSWSDDVEKDADIVIMLEQSMEQSTHDCFVIEGKVKKNRDGLAGGSVFAEFEKSTQRFLPWPRLI
jgi:replicative DNA helicase